MKLQDQIQSSQQRHAKPKEATWARVEWVVRLTGWNAELLRQAREQGLIEYKKEGKAYLYKIDSIHPYFLKNRQTQSP